MRLIALCGAAGAGKDTVADMLPCRKLAFADTLYSEVAAAWGVTLTRLRMRDLKEVEQEWFALENCSDRAFYRFARSRVFDTTDENDTEVIAVAPRSTRQILQWWGDYRRAQDPDYFLWKLAERRDRRDNVVITDVRFPNEAAMVRQLGGQIWQIKRPGYEAGGTGHASDTDGSEFEPDHILANCGTPSDLQALALHVWESA